MRARTVTRAALAAVLQLATAPALAHLPLDGFVSLRPHGTEVAVQIDAPLQDVDAELGLDGDGDGAVSDAEAAARWPEIEGLVLGHIGLETDGHDCDFRPARRARAVERSLQTHNGGRYAVFRFEARCGVVPRSLEIEYRLFAESNPAHRAIVRFDASGFAGAASAATTIVGPGVPRHRFTAAPAPLDTVRRFLVQGVWHIWLGFDHVLFLLALLLPAVRVRRDTPSGPAWEPAERAAPVALDVLRVVTAFTVAHSITLTLAVYGLVSLPARIVEPVIAATVVLAALNNLKPIVREGRWLAAFGFGLVHGFGFAGALADVGIPAAGAGAALLGFNVGVELGQLAIVACFVPLIYSIRRTALYRTALVTVGSAAVAAIALVWLVQRATA